MKCLLSSVLFHIGKHGDESVLGKYDTYDTFFHCLEVKANIFHDFQDYYSIRTGYIPAYEHNSEPYIVQTQLYRLTELFLRKANLPVIRRTAETELAVADAINIEKEVADRSNSKVVYLNLCSREISHRSDDSKFVRARESNTSPLSEAPIDRQEQGSSECLTDPMVDEALRAAGLLSDSPPNSPHCKTEVPNEVDDSSIKVKEEEPDNVFEMDSHMEMDIYGEFEYDLEDEDYIGMNAEKVQKLQPEESLSKMKVVFSTIATENSNNVVGLEDHGRLGKVELPTDSSYMQKNNTDAAIRPLTVEDGTNKTCVPLETLPDEEGEELSLAECEELYGPDKEPLINKIPEELQKLCGMVDTEASAVNEVTANSENAALNQGVNASKSDADVKAGNLVANVGQSSSSCEHSSDINCTGENIQKKGTSSTKINKQCDVNPVSKKVFDDAVELFSDVSIGTANTYITRTMGRWKFSLHYRYTVASYLTILLF